MYPQPTAIDLFAGAGGATQGLKDAGYRVLAAIESDDSAARSYYLNHPDVTPFFFDIRDVEPDLIRKSLGLEYGDLTLLKACPPCQGFSTLGATRSDDPRNELVSEVWRFTKAFKPRAVLLENVPGIAGDPRFHRLKRQLRADGYRVREYLIDAADFGVPQHRRRLIVVGVRTQRTLPSQLPTGRHEGKHLTVRDALDMLTGITAELDPLHRSRQLAPQTLERIKAIPVGGGRFDLPPNLQLSCHVNAGRSAASSYGRLRLNEPAPTMTTRCTTPACGRFIHPTEHRGLTLREAATFQTFPLTYRFVGNYGQIERQVGNAVPVKLAEALGLIVRSLLQEAMEGAES